MTMMIIQSYSKIRGMLKGITRKATVLKLYNKITVPVLLNGSAAQVVLSQLILDPQKSFFFFKDQFGVAQE
jgi:hypothetical protein